MGNGTDYSKTSQADINTRALKAAEDTAQNTGKTAQTIFTAMGNVAIQGADTAVQTFDAVSQGLDDSYSNVIGNIERLRSSYGGLADDEFEFFSNRASSQAMRRLQTINLAFVNSSKSLAGMAVSGEEALASVSDSSQNILRKYFETEGEAAAAMQSILGDLSTTYGAEVGKLGEDQIIKMAFYEESLGASASTLQDIFAKQIGFTGEISTDALDKLGAYARNLSDELSIPMKTLTKMTTQMMSNTEMFGDITAEEATRMSAKLTQLGFTFEELSTQQQKFGTFAGAAQAAGTITQLTGAQVDAMKMSYLTSEGRFDELIEYQRDSLLKAGMTKEKFMSQSNSMRNAIAKAFGREQSELALMLDTTRRVDSQEQLDSIMKEGKVKEEEGFDTLLKNLKQTQNAFKKVEELAAEKQRKLLLETADSAMKSAKAMNDFNINLVETVDFGTEDQSRFITEMHTGIQGLAGIDLGSIGTNFKDIFGVVETKLSGVATESERIMAQAREAAGIVNDIDGSPTNTTTAPAAPVIPQRAQALSQQLGGTNTANQTLEVSSGATNVNVQIGNESIESFITNVAQTEAKKETLELKSLIMGQNYVRGF